jgi:integrase
LEVALSEAARYRWASCRDGGKALISSARLAVESLSAAKGRAASATDVTKEDLRAQVRTWRDEGLAPSTIIKRLGCLSVLGVDVRGTRPRRDRSLKWWLQPDQEVRAVEWLSDQDYPGKAEDYPDRALAFLIRWTTRTGLRIEETLRLTLGDLSHDFREVVTPGTKTRMSQATLPLSGDASAIVREWVKTRGLRGHSTRLLTINYDRLCTRWQDLREAMDWPENATMKALRRSAARHLHVDFGMPLDMVRQYLRHENINTTMMYLHLTGGYGADEMRRFLK